MKKLYTIAIALLCGASVVTAQQVPTNLQKGAVVNSTKSVPLHMQNQKTATDTIGWGSGIPLFASSGGGLSTYGMVDANGGKIGYWFGVNYDAAEASGSDFWAQCYVNDATLGIEGALAMVAGKSNVSNSSSSVLTVSLQDMEADMCLSGGTSPNYTKVAGPTGTIRSSASIAISNIDTVWNPNLGFNYFAFPSTQLVSGADFALVADFSTLRTNQDTAYFLCDAAGDGMGLHFTQYNSDPTSYYWVSTNLATSGTLDVNMSLFAVVDANYIGIDSPNFYQGMKLTINPNPVQDVANLQYAVQYNSNVTIDIIDMNGRTIKSTTEGSKTAGNYTSTINVSELSKGTYFLSLNSNGNRLIKKMIVE